MNPIDQEAILNRTIEYRIIGRRDFPDAYAETVSRYVTWLRLEMCHTGRSDALEFAVEVAAAIAKIDERSPKPFWMICAGLDIDEMDRLCRR